MTEHNDSLRHLPPVADEQGDVWDGVADLIGHVQGMHWSSNGYPVDEGLIYICIEQIVRQARTITLDEVLERMKHTDSWRLDEHGRDIERVIEEIRHAQ